MSHNTTHRMPVRLTTQFIRSNNDVVWEMLGWTGQSTNQTLTGQEEGWALIVDLCNRCSVSCQQQGGVPPHTPLAT